MPSDQHRLLKEIKVLFETFELDVAERSLKKSGEAVRPSAFGLST